MSETLIIGRLYFSDGNLEVVNQAASSAINQLPKSGISAATLTSGISAATITRSLGLWESKTEFGFVVEVIWPDVLGDTDDNREHDLRCALSQTAGYLARYYGQESVAVLVTREEGSFKLVNKNGEST